MVSGAPSTGLHPPRDDQIIYVATQHPADDGARELADRLSARVPAVIGESPNDYVRLQDRIWGIVTWAPSSAAELFEGFGVPPTLRWLHQSGVGVEDLARSPVPTYVCVTSIKGNDYYATPMAEYVLARILEWAKQLPRLRDSQERAEWRQFDPVKLAGASAMVFGSGSIGKAVAKRLAAFDMRILLVRRSIRGRTIDGWESVDLSQAKARLGAADYVVLALPLTAATRNLLGATELARMKPSSFIVNVGRAALIDEMALAEALREERIGGVALDVFWREPLPADDPVWRWPRTMVSPHMSANVRGGHAAAIADTAVETLSRILKGQYPSNQVDLRVGY